MSLKVITFPKKKIFFLSVSLSIFTIILILFILFKDNNFAQASIALMHEDKSVINVGSKVYAVNCASCHGIKLEGQKDWMSRLPNGMMPAPPHDETGHTWHHSDKYLFMITKYGIEKIIGEKYLNNMPAYEEILSDKEIIAVLSYIKSTWPPRIKKIHDQINSRSNK